MPDWDQLQDDVTTKITLLRHAWQHTEQSLPEIHDAMARDLYIPALKHLAAFCSSITFEDEQRGDMPDGNPKD